MVYFGQDEILAFLNSLLLILFILIIIFTGRVSVVLLILFQEGFKSELIFELLFIFIFLVIVIDL